MAGKKQRAEILLIDDHHMISDALEYYINRKSRTARVTCTVGDRGKVYVKLRDHAFNLVLLNLSLRGFHATDILRYLRKNYPTLPVLTYSLYDFDEIVAEHAIICGARGYITTWHAQDHLLDAINTVLGGSMYLCPEFKTVLLKRHYGDGTTEDLHPLFRLSDREMKVLLLIGQGMSSRDIAARLHITVKTVDSHRSRISSKLGLKPRSKLLSYAIVCTRGWYKSVLKES